MFLFDEPLSNLDAALRVQTRIEIANLHNELKSTVVYVTHDQVEAMTLADDAQQRLQVEPGASVTLGIRPEHLREGTGGTVQLQGKVELIERSSDVSYVYLHRDDGTRLSAALPGSSRTVTGEQISVSADAAAVHVFDDQEQAFTRLDTDPRYRLEAEL